MKRFIRAIISPFYAVARKLFGGMGLRKYAVIDSVYKAIMPMARANYTEINGYKLHLDVLDGIEVANGEFEKTTTEFFMHAVHPGDVILDIGADIGYYTFLAALKAGPSGKVFAFEPNPATFVILEKNAALNGYSNVILIPKATGDMPGEMPFYDHGPHSSMGYDRFSDGKPSRMVPVVRLDDVIPAATTVTILKIDIEGSEPRALRGATRILSTPQLTLVFEFYPRLMRMAGNDPKAYLAWLAEYGFVFYDLNGAGLSKPVSIDELCARYPEDSEQMTNLVGKK